MDNMTTAKWLTALWALTILPNGAQAGDSLTAAEIRKLVPGTYHVSVADSVSATAIFTKGGGISVTTNKGENDTGRWSLSGNKMCVVFKHLLDHKANCSALTVEGKAIHGNGFTARRK